MPLRPEDLEAFAAVHYDDYDVPSLDDPESFAPATGLGGVTPRDAIMLGLAENLDMRLPHLPVPQADGGGPCQICAVALDDEVHHAAG